MERVKFLRLVGVFTLVLSIAVLFPTACSRDGHGHGNLIIDVKELGNGNTISGVLVRINDSSKRTNEEGLVVFKDVPLGRHTVTAEKYGFLPREELINLQESTRHSIELERSSSHPPDPPDETIEGVNVEYYDMLNIYTLTMETTPHVFRATADERLMHYEGDGYYSLATTAFSKGDEVEILVFDRYGDVLQSKLLLLE